MKCSRPHPLRFVPGQLMRQPRPLRASRTNASGEKHRRFVSVETTNRDELLLRHISDIAAELHSLRPIPISRKSRREKREGRSLFNSIIFLPESCLSVGPSNPLYITVLLRLKAKRMRSSRSSRCGTEGIKLALSKPWCNRSAIHSASLVSVFRPGKSTPVHFRFPFSAFPH